MEELIAKKYIRALNDGSSTELVQYTSGIFTALADSFKDKKFLQIIENPNVSSSVKSDILLEAVKSAESSKINNFIKLLVEKKRINVIPAIAQELKKEIARSTKTYTGIVYSDTKILIKTIRELSSGLSKKFDLNISLKYVKSDFNGIKVDVEDLGIEINFSKQRISNQMIEHIIKAI